MDGLGRAPIVCDRRARLSLASQTVLARLAWVDAEDRLDVDGGYGGARQFGVIPVGSARGPEVTRSQLVRNLAELAVAPLAASRARGPVWSADGDDAFTLAAPGTDADAIV